MSNRFIVAGDTLKVEALVWSVVGLQAEWGPATSLDWYHKLINNHKVCECTCTNLEIEHSLLSLSPLLSVVHVEHLSCHMSSCPHSQCPNMHSYTAAGDSKPHGEEQDLSTCTWEPPKQKFLGSMLQLDDNLDQKRLFRWPISGLREPLPQRFKRLHGAAHHKCFISWRAEGAGNLGWVWQAQLFLLLVHTPTHKYWIWILLHL